MSAWGPLPAMLSCADRRGWPGRPAADWGTIRAMHDLRPSAVAGSWYPGSQARLAEAVDAHIAAASDSSRSCPRAIIAPHAGLMYSGPVAAYAYRLVRQCAYTAVVLVGAAPPGGVDGGAGWGRGAGGTP